MHPRDYAPMWLECACGYIVPALGVEPCLVPKPLPAFVHVSGKVASCLHDVQLHPGGHALHGSEHVAAGGGGVPVA